MFDALKASHIMGRQVHFSKKIPLHFIRLAMPVATSTRPQGPVMIRASFVVNPAKMSPEHGYQEQHVPANIHKSLSLVSTNCHNN